MALKGFGLKNQISGMPEACSLEHVRPVSLCDAFISPGGNQRLRTHNLGYLLEIQWSVARFRKGKVRSEV